PLQVDVEWRDWPPSKRAGHGRMIPDELQPPGLVCLGRQHARLFRKADVASERDGLAGDQRLDRAILLTTVLHRVWHEARVDDDGLAARQPRRDEGPGALTGNVRTDRRTGGEHHHVR